MHLQDNLNKHIDEMLERDVFEPSSIIWASGIVLDWKKDVTTRFHADYRKLTVAVIKDAYSFLRMHETLDHLSGVCQFSILYMYMSPGYLQVDVEEKKIGQKMLIPVSDHAFRLL